MGEDKQADTNQSIGLSKIEYAKIQILCALIQSKPDEDIKILKDMANEISESLFW